jgi:hypothetical protein
VSKSPCPWPMPERLKLLDELEVRHYLWPDPVEGSCLVFDWTYEDLYGKSVNVAVDLHRAAAHEAARE